MIYTMRAAALVFLPAVLAFPAFAGSFEEEMASSQSELVGEIKDNEPSGFPCDPTFLEPVGLPETADNPLANFGVVSEGIFRGAKLDDERDYRYLAEELGVSVVINMRCRHTDDDALCAEHGLECLDYQLWLLPGGDAFFDWKTFRAAFRRVLLERAAGRKVFFHCLHGADRTGALASALAIRETACGREFDRAGLWKRIETVLDRHGFHRTFRFLYRDIKSWVFEFERYPWLCADPSDG